MAYREIELTEEERKGGSFFKFAAIGDKLLGIFLKTRTVTGLYGPKTEYLFRTREGEVTFTPPIDAARKLAKAGLRPGNKVLVTYASDLDVGKESPMKVFKVLVDDSVSPLTAPAPTPAPARARELGSDDDIPF